MVGERVESVGETMSAMNWCVMSVAERVSAMLEKRAKILIQGALNTWQTTGGNMRTPPYGNTRKLNMVVAWIPAIQ